MILLTFIISIIGLVNCANFPADVPRCKLEDSTCIGNSITYLIEKSFTNGHKGLKLIKTEPLRIKNLKIDQNAKSPVNIQLKFTDIDMIGLSKAKVKNVRVVKKSATTQDIEISGFIPELSLVGPYTVKGKVLILPIVGQGNSNLTLDNVEANVKLVTKIDEQNNKSYFKLNRVILKLNISRLHVQLKNLFNGNKELGDNMNLFINENWIDIYSELQPAIEKAIGQILEKIIDNVFSSFPYDELFLI